MIIDAHGIFSTLGSRHEIGIVGEYKPRQPESRRQRLNYDEAVALVKRSATSAKRSGEHGYPCRLMRADSEKGPSPDRDGITGKFSVRPMDVLTNPPQRFCRPL
jgi:hypothetical protein